MSLSQREDTMIGIEGHIKIWDPASGEVLVRRRNAVNFENMSIAIANLLSNKAGSTSTHQIGTMRFGNGGTTIDSVGLITYKTPNVTDAAGTLYNQTYVKSITSTTDVNNSMSIYHSALQNYTDIVVTSTLSYGEPEGQDDIDTATTKTDFVFDEIGLINELGSTLTHIIFHPIQKSAIKLLKT